jgi:hypothetical protein
MSDKDGKLEGGEATPERGGGYEGAGPEYGRGYGRDFGGGGLDQGFDGSWGQGYGGSIAPTDSREGFGAGGSGGGLAAGDYARTNGGRGDNFGPDDRSWIDRCADEELAGHKRRYVGRGPKDWSRGDQALYVEVCERLLHDRLIDPRGIEVEVEDGVVTVRGEAAAPADPALIDRLVRAVPGVKGLELELHVRPQEGQPRRREEPQDDDRTDKSSLAAPILARRAPPPDSAGAP